MQLPLPPVQLREKLHSSGGNSDDHWEKKAVIGFILSLLQNHPHGALPGSSNTVETWKEIPLCLPIFFIPLNTVIMTETMRKKGEDENEVRYSYVKHLA